VTSRIKDQPSQEYELLGNELHDGPCQYLLSAQMLLEAFRHAQRELPAGDARNLEMVADLMDRAVVELRRLVHGLQPLQLNGAGIEACLKRLVAENEACGGPQVEFYHDGEFGALPQPLIVAILRIAQESLANARRHSKSVKVLLGLTRDDECISLQVQDWGVGFKADRVRQGCHGLKGICHRVALLGGRATIDSQPGLGTCITAEFPLPHGPVANDGDPQLAS
jgi:signal transduction histidine kinase